MEHCNILNICLIVCLILSLAVIIIVVGITSNTKTCVQQTASPVVAAQLVNSDSTKSDSTKSAEKDFFDIFENIYDGSKKDYICLKQVLKQDVRDNPVKIGNYIGKLCAKSEGNELCSKYRFPEALFRKKCG